ncbi:MAG TPA: polyprenol monophosphomannose synthase [Acidimicrobiales bacterium]|nr:polyprenol monophosphomannose synthase [Acidimicrobiales bacterium]
MRVLVVIPTYREAENIGALLRQLRVTVPGADLLVVDDGSDDGTTGFARVVGGELGRIDVLERPVKDGLGRAYRAGFGWGLERGYEVLVSMDADFSHDPKALPGLLAAVGRGADLVIGSRYVPGGSIPEWPAYRRALSRYGNRYASFILGLDLSDVTSGYRAYRADALHVLYRREVRTGGYGALIEMAYRVAGTGAVVTEVPISFVDRQLGQSKMSGAIALETLWHVTRMGIMDRWQRPRRRVGRRLAAPTTTPRPPPPG